MIATGAAIAAAIGAGATAAGQIVGAKGTSNAARTAAASQERSETAQLAFAREQAAAEDAREKARQDREQRNFEIQQQFQRDQWTAQEEERLYKRKIFEDDRAAELADKKAAEDARARAYQDSLSYQPPAPDPYTQQRIAMRNNALANVGQLLGMRPGTGVGYAMPGGQPLNIAQLLQMRGR